jgi:hypothetical protein
MQISTDLQANIRHQPVKVPCHRSPFKGLPPTVETAFWDGLQEVEDSGFHPDNMSISPEEWDDSIYPTLEVLTAGWRAKE